ncbi:MAG: ABC transporter ATP-binding protein [Candidatus Marinimicrobia bacterium]|nr:ABC transporter ATP-binding protein [Candidatus Neomarinimicrobiota bacterium]
MIIHNAHLEHFPRPIGTDIELKKGECVLLLGNSGCGKTSLLKAIAGFSDLHAGEIDRNNKRVAMLLQNPFNQIIMQKVWDELYFPLKNAGKSEEEIDLEIEKIAEILKIEHLLDRNISTLSFGETQLSMIAATCLTKADIFLMDEPTSHLDPPGINTFYKYMSKLANSGKSILITSQSPDEYRFVDKVWIMEDGKIKAKILADTCPETLNEQNIILDSILIKMRLKELKQK